MLPPMEPEWRERKIAELEARRRDPYYSSLYDEPLEHRDLETILANHWQAEIEERAERLKRCQSALRDAMPKRAAEVALTTSTDIEPIAAVEDWYRKRERCLLALAGPPGSGKTVAGVYAAWLHTKRYGRAPRFLRAAQLAAMSRYSDERGEVLSADMLVVDDVGAEYSDAKGSWLADFDELIDTFYADKRPLVLTTNLPRAAFASRYGQRIEDRLREAGEWVVVAGESRRGKS